MAINCTNVMQHEPEQLQSFLDAASVAALAGGAVLQSYWGKLENIQEKSYPGDLVTEADKAAEAAVLEVVQRHFPQHSILSEESGQQGSLESEYLWAIDPLDGTTNYVHQYPFFATSIALLIGGEPLVGAVFAPFHNELFLAATGLGATCNGRPIQVSKTADLSKSLLGAGAYYSVDTPNNFAEFCHLTYLTQGVRQSGSAALDLAHVACGRLDGYCQRGLSPWDVAAGLVLVREAGGQITTYDGSFQVVSSGQVLATNSLIHSALSRELSQLLHLL